MRHLLAALACLLAGVGVAAADSAYAPYLSGRRLVRIGLAVGYDRVRILSDGPVRLARYPGQSGALPPGVSIVGGAATGTGRCSVRVTGIQSSQEREQLAASLRRRGYQVETDASDDPDTVSILNIPTRRRAELIAERLNRMGSGVAEVLEPTADTQGRTELVIDARAARGSLAADGALDIVAKASASVSFRAYRTDRSPKELHSEGQGTLRIVAGKSGVSVVGLMPIDEYLRGVLTREMSPEFEMEALKAQAIIARTYALSNLGKHEAAGFDLCATFHCQSYGGAQSTSQRTDAAIVATRGQIITCGGRLSGALFHTVCGGRTEDVESIWDSHDPSLRGIVDSPRSASPFQLATNLGLGGFLKSDGDAYCKHSKLFRWAKAFTRGRLAEAFAKSLPRLFPKTAKPLGQLLDVRVIERSRNGRAQRLVILGSDATYEVKKDAIRWAFGDGTVGNGLYSTLFVIRAQEGQGGLPERFEISGGGWGHGAGLCQAGANAMAKVGRDCDTILHHYYTDIAISPARG